MPLAGDLVARYVDVRVLTKVAGGAFIAIGVWTIVKA
jgi:putative Ca2+/H+ antiporter (TMEM165/GDT1 family)